MTSGSAFQTAGRHQSEPLIRLPGEEWNKFVVMRMLT